MGQYQEPKKEIKSEGAKQTPKMTSDIEDIINRGKKKPRKVKGGLKITAGNMSKQLRTK